MIAGGWIMNFALSGTLRFLAALEMTRGKVEMTGGNVVMTGRRFEVGGYSSHGDLADRIFFIASAADVFRAASKAAKSFS